MLKSMTKNLLFSVDTTILERIWVHNTPSLITYLKQKYQQFYKKGRNIFNTKLGWLGYFHQYLVQDYSIVVVFFRFIRIFFTGGKLTRIQDLVVVAGVYQVLFLRTGRNKIRLYGVRSFVQSIMSAQTSGTKRKMYVMTKVPEASPKQKSIEGCFPIQHLNDIASLD